MHQGLRWVVESVAASERGLSRVILRYLGGVLAFRGDWVGGLGLVGGVLCYWGWGVGCSCSGIENF